MPQAADYCNLKEQLLGEQQDTAPCVTSLKELQDRREAVPERTNVIAIYEGAD